MADSTERFSDRVADYVRYRPSYPRAAVDLLRERCGLEPRAAVADLGSGTGKLTELLLAASFTVYAVEPNAAMRKAAEASLGGRAGFVSVSGRAEATSLPDASVELVTAAQAFHWFDQNATRVEARRILRPGGCAALLWNDRTEGSAFAEEYEAILRELSVDYGEVDRAGKTGTEAVERFFGRYEHASFGNPQETDFPGLVGRYLSASYAYQRDDPRFPRAEGALRGLYERHAREGKLEMPLTTHVYWGRVRETGPA